MSHAIADVAEQKRLNEAREAQVPWKKWGPYLSERQWGTVREDYSDDGDAWNYFTHDQARSRAYRWGEDGLAGICDDKQRLCFALALWNGRDPILKERLFGLTNSEGNHGEDVKEYYFYLDSTPTHSYMKYLYKYPQRAFPYADLVETNRARGRARSSSTNCSTPASSTTTATSTSSSSTPRPARRTSSSGSPSTTAGPRRRRLHVLPTLWFRNTWSWGEDEPQAVARAPRRAGDDSGRRTTSWASTGCYCDGDPELLFTENETNTQRLWGQPNASPYVKDAFHALRRHRATHEAVNPGKAGHQGRGPLRARRARPAAARRSACGSAARQAPTNPFGRTSRRRSTSRIAEADEFYAADHAAVADRGPSAACIARRWPACCGASSTTTTTWTAGCASTEPSADRGRARAACATPTGSTCSTTTSSRCRTSGSTRGTRPGTWPSTRSSLALVDFDFAKEQLLLMLRNAYLHPNGQIPAYEWNFSDVNPPVHAWATLFLYKMREARAAAATCGSWSARSRG